jgi:DNA-directed RNA polymerase subunit F
MAEKNGGTEKGKSPNIKISEIARSEKPKDSSSEEIINGEPIITDNLPVVRQPQNIIRTSEQAWIEGTQGLQKNLIRGLQEYRSGILGWKERGLLSQKRQQMISEVTEQYIRFLREEARITSDAALQARRAILQKQLHELKGKLYTDIADIAGVTVSEIELVFQTHYAKLTDPEIQKFYAKFVWEKIADLLDTENLK